MSWTKIIVGSFALGFYATMGAGLASAIIGYLFMILS